MRLIISVYACSVWNICSIRFERAFNQVYPNGLNLNGQVYVYSLLNGRTLLTCNYIYRTIPFVYWRMHPTSTILQTFAWKQQAFVSSLYQFTRKNLFRICEWLRICLLHNSYIVANTTTNISCLSACVYANIIRLTFTGNRSHSQMDGSIHSELKALSSHVNRFRIIIIEQKLPTVDDLFGLKFFISSPWAKSIIIYSDFCKDKHFILIHSICYKYCLCCLKNISADLDSIGHNNSNSDISFHCFVNSWIFVDWFVLCVQLIWTVIRNLHLP